MNDNKLGKNQQRIRPENLQDDSEFSRRSPAYKPPHVKGHGVMPAMENANIDLKLKLLKEQLLEEFTSIFASLVVDGGDLDA